MCEYVTKGIEKLEDYNKYAHYVAGVVGIGLSNMFAASELECTLRSSFFA
jgi:farnesyl-diphosphate farnesyltransferase